MRGHGPRIAIIWFVATVIVEILLIIAPIPMGSGSARAAGINQTILMLFYVGAPIFVFVWVMLLYNVIVFRARGRETAEPVPRPDSNPILFLWAALSFTIVIFLAGWGTFTLHEVSEPNGHPLLHIQVIGQQWFWSYRYPSYGGMETRKLYVPLNTPIEFDITSLDVTHSFWLYRWDIKEDAVPGVHTIAYADIHQIARINAVCNELCGLYHGYMHGPVRSVSKTDFVSWAKKTEAFEKRTGFLKYLPKFSYVYYPSSNSFTPPPPQDQSP